MEFNKYQKKAIDLIEGNVCVIATAGSGKTSVLIERIKNMVLNHGIRAENILAISFSKKACDNLEVRLNQYSEFGLHNVVTKTFHALALNVVEAFHDQRINVWTNTWEKRKILFEICEKLKLCRDIDDLPEAELFMFLADQKNNMIKPSGKLVFTDNIPYNKKNMKDIYKKYEDKKKELGYYEFDDLVNEACDIFKKCPDILKIFTDKYKYISVDEYQDISYNQNCFLKCLSTGNMFAVGDSLQAIYSFRGGDCKYLLNFNKEWDNAQVINLPINYRCSKDIVETSNSLATNVPDSRNKFYKPAISNHDKYKKPVLKQFEQISQECDFIINTIQKGVTDNKYQYNDYAILTRTNAQLQILQTGLVRKNIGFDMAGELSFFELPEIQIFISYLRLASNVGDNKSFEYCFNKPNRWLNKAFLDEAKGVAKGGSLYFAMFNIDRRNWRFKKGIDELYLIINHLQHKKYRTVDRYVMYIRETLDIDAFESKCGECNKESISEKIENINLLVDICKEYKTISDFLSHVNEISRAIKDNSGKGNTVKLMTIHKSKGLEFPVVFISGVSDGLLPHKRNSNIDDEKRLFYVGITRAEKELYLTSSRSYNGKEYCLSPFISYIKENINLKEK